MYTNRDDICEFFKLMALSEIHCMITEKQFFMHSLGFTHLATQCVLEVASPGARLPRCGTNHSLPSNAKVDLYLHSPMSLLSGA